MRGATEGIGLISLAQDIGIKLDVRMHVDASAALGIIERRGVGRVRHLDVGTLWLQEQQLRRILEIRKVEGLKNPGDLFTKNLALERVDTFSGMIGYKFVSGRAAGTAALDHVVTKKVEAEQSVDDPCVARSDNSVSVLSQEAKCWFRISPHHLRGSFRNARAHRSPCCTGVSWNSVSRIVTRASPSGRIIRDVRPRDLRITEKQYCNHINGCSDIVTDVYLDKSSGDAWPGGDALGVEDEDTVSRAPEDPSLRHGATSVATLNSSTELCTHQPLSEPSVPEARPRAGAPYKVVPVDSGWCVHSSVESSPRASPPGQASPERAALAMPLPPSRMGRACDAPSPLEDDVVVFGVAGPKS